MGGLNRRQLWLNNIVLFINEQKIRMKKEGKEVYDGDSVPAKTHSFIR